MTVDIAIEDPVYENRMRSSSIRAPPRGVQEFIKGRNLLKKLFRTEYNLTLFKIGWSAKRPPASFSPVTFSFNPFDPLVSTLSASSKLLYLNQEHPSKKLFFLVTSL